MRRYQLIFAALILIMSACQSKNEGPVNTTLSKVKNLDAALDPSNISFVYEYYYLDNLTRRLLSLDKTRNYRPDLAENINISEDKISYTVELKQAYFSDGTQITAHDVISSFKRLILKGSNHTNPSKLFKDAHLIKTLDDNCPGLEFVSKTKLIIHLQTPNNEFLDYLTLSDFGILSEQQYSTAQLSFKHWLNKTSGPYFLSVKGDSTQLLANAHYPHREGAPKIINCKSQLGIDQSITTKDLDYGPIPFNYYLANQKKLEELDYTILNSPNQFITTLALNTKSNKYSEYNRKWIYKKLINTQIVPEKYKHIVKRAVQYFVPMAKGHINVDDVKALVNSWEVDIKTIPNELQSGLEIVTFIRSDEYAYPELANSLANALGVPVNIHFTLEPANFSQFLEQRNYDVFLIPVFMDYKIISEALNLSFAGKNPFFIDDSGEVKKLLEKYLKLSDENEMTKTIQEIIFQIINDSEVIPLFYGFSPFIKSKRLDISHLGQREFYQLWNLNVLQD